MAYKLKDYDVDLGHIGLKGIKHRCDLYTKLTGFLFPVKGNNSITVQSTSYIDDQQVSTAALHVKDETNEEDGVNPVNVLRNIPLDKPVTATTVGELIDAMRSAVYEVFPLYAPEFADAEKV